jgi:hypothetical protein
VKLADGSPAFAMLDQHVSPRGNDSFFVTAAARPHATLPWWVCASEAGFIEGPLPADNAAAVAALSAKFGPAPQTNLIGAPMPPRGPPKVYGDQNWQEIFNPPPGKGKGYRSRKDHPFFAAAGSVPNLKTFAEVIPVIPRSEWPARIAVMDAAWAWPSDACDFGGSTDPLCRDQQQTSYCWVNGPAACIDITRRIQGLSLGVSPSWVETSAASIGGPITNYSNEGGWGLDGMQYLAATGAVATDLWPNTAIASRYNTPAVTAARQHRQAVEWVELESNNTDQLGTSLLLGYVSTLGLDWWGHQITVVQLVQVSPGTYGWMIRNSWGDWGTKNRYGMAGFQVLSESKSKGDACLLRAVTDWPSVLSAPLNAVKPAATPAACPSGTCPMPTSKSFSPAWKESMFALSP